MTKRNNQKNAGDSEFLMIIVGALVLLFALWVYYGGPNDPSAKKPFIKPYNSDEPLRTYGPEDIAPNPNYQTQPQPQPYQ
jgi:hypothetical protein